MYNLTEGNVTRCMVSFAIPLLLGNVLQQLYSVAAAVIVGNFVGKAALAAVGTAAPIMNILMFLMVGITMGSSILMSEFFGAGKHEKVRQEEVTSLLSGLIFTIVLSVAMIFLINPLLLLIQTPVEIMPQAEAYLEIIIAGLVFTFLYNILSSSLRSIGDSMTPLFFLIFSSVLNIGIGVVLVKQFGWGVCGVAYATVIAQAVSTVLCMGYIYWKVPILRFHVRDLKINFPLLAKTASYSSVSAIQQTFLYVGIFILQGAVNPLGVDAIAAYNAVTRIDSFILAPTDSLALALTTFISQNRGAKKVDRIRHSMKSSVVIGVSFCGLLAVSVFFSAQALMTFFLDSGEVSAIEVGVKYLKIMAIFYILPAFCNSFQGFFRGLGRMDITLFATIVQIPVRVILAYLLVELFGLSAVAVGVAVGWICMIVYEAHQYRQYY
ncbi:MATE family efflux transporter [Sporomusa sp. KB1]|uniref:MATE family efflux transporter n=1 Tax=Sporomusa sp. KB1 TaxID=943346 RepID=UPI0011A49799|nr:MATE family efflux transporter [Sporomusa sp. KB1]TWH47725.1 putative MATE family efflux protein [Sporomusa sp. KB1]